MPLSEELDKARPCALCGNKELYFCVIGFDFVPNLYYVHSTCKDHDPPLSGGMSRGEAVWLWNKAQEKRSVRNRLWTAIDKAKEGYVRSAEKFANKIAFLKYCCKTALSEYEEKLFQELLGTIDYYRFIGKYR